MKMTKKLGQLKVVTKQTFLPFTAGGFSFSFLNHRLFFSFNGDARDANLLYSESRQKDGVSAFSTTEEPFVK